VHDVRQAITDLLVEYCYIVDDARWQDLNRIYVRDVTFALPARDVRLLGLDDLTAWYMAGSHPRAHLLTNALVDITDATHARARSKYLTPQASGLVGTGEYADELERTEDGWRIRSRVVTVRMGPVAPGGSAVTAPG
jgi:3-phenylpropionate/cinnamic acid dioxygenase small subunit